MSCSCVWVCIYITPKVFIQAAHPCFSCPLIFLTSQSLKSPVAYVIIPCQPFVWVKKQCRVFRVQNVSQSKCELCNLIKYLSPHLCAWRLSKQKISKKSVNWVAIWSEAICTYPPKQRVFKRPVSKKSLCKQAHAHGLPRSKLLRSCVTTHIFRTIFVLYVQNP